MRGSKRTNARRTESFWAESREGKRVCEREGGKEHKGNRTWIRWSSSLQR